MSAERGFTLLETAFALALTGGVALGATAAVLAASRAATAGATRDTLSDDASNVLADLRAATGYDAPSLARLAGRRYTATIAPRGVPLAVNVDVTRADATGALLARVTVANPDGARATEERALYLEAPAPGSTVEQVSPASQSGS